jgi:mannose-1-phosphate guanylyltransferase/phosphomannomutase
MRGVRNILTGVVDTSIPGKQIKPNLWVGENVEIDPTASLKGPVVIGDHVRIGAGATIIGPASIGANVEIGREVFIEESAIWDDCILGERASLTGTILGKGAVLKPEATLKDGCIVENRYTVEADKVYDHDTVLSFP